MDSVYIVIPVLIILMFCLGLELNLSDFRRLLLRPRSLFVGLTGQMLILPLVAFLLAQYSNLSTELKIGIVLIGCCPGGVSSNIFTMLAGGNIALSVLLTAVSSVLSVFTLPLIVGYAVERFSGQDIQLHLPVVKVVMQGVILVLLPLFAGGVLKRIRPSWSSSAVKVLKKLATPLLLIVVIIFTIEKYSQIAANFYLVSMSVVLLLILTMLAGFILSRLGKLQQADRKSIIIEIGLQNAAQAITIAISPMLLNNKEIAIPAIIYAVLMNLVVFTYVFYSRRYVN